MQDRHFLCLHYRLGKDMQLLPCSPGEADDASGCASAPPLLPHMEPELESGSACETHKCLLSTTHIRLPPAWTESLRQTACRTGIGSSNLQLGIMVRKGVGGTTPARQAGRKLCQQGLLPALLDPLPVQVSACRPVCCSLMVL